MLQWDSLLRQVLTRCSRRGALGVGRRTTFSASGHLYICHVYAISDRAYQWTICKQNIYVGLLLTVEIKLNGRALHLLARKRLGKRNWIVRKTSKSLYSRYFQDNISDRSCWVLAWSPGARFVHPSEVLRNLLMNPPQVVLATVSEGMCKDTSLTH